MGDRGRDIPLETQFLLVKTKDGSHLESDDGNDENQIVYTVFLPLIEGSFRSCLQGNDGDELELCLESGDVDTKASSFSHSLFISSGTDPFATITDAIRAVKLHLKTFRQRHEKKLPGIVDYFGWCTWDAFYQEVTQEGVEAGLESLASVGGDEKEKENENDQQLLLRLIGIKENSKFQNKDDPTVGIKSIVNIAKEKHGLKYGGVRPGVEEMEQYGSLMKYPIACNGTDVLVKQGLGLVNPKSVNKFYSELHNYLASAGIDGVKVDVQCILETLGARLGGQVELTRQYHQALDASVSRNFPNNGIIACMSHNTDALYCSKQMTMVRTSDDFFPRDPISHTIHIATVAYSSVFLGEFMQPNWDMFHSFHPAAEYHESARTISGGPLYVSDKPGNHNFELLKKLVLPDGSILRARLLGRPTRDCLFNDPARDGPKPPLSPTGMVIVLFIVTAWVLAPGFGFSPLGLINMFNAGGAIEGLRYEVKVGGAQLLELESGHEEERVENNSSELVGIVPLEVKGNGKFGAFSLARPRRCKVDSNVVDFVYDSESRLVTLSLDQSAEEGQKVHFVEVEL
ncbi:putative galactinol--sucrose galactosyltransferase 6 [Fagus crenata]